jgi:hypothetical protein
MTCDACKDGYNISQVTGKENVCNICEGTAQLESCNTFNPGDRLVIFQGTRCITCGVAKNNHKVGVSVGT